MAAVAHPASGPVDETAAVGESVVFGTSRLASERAEKGLRARRHANHLYDKALGVTPEGDEEASDGGDEGEEEEEPKAPLPKLHAYDFRRVQSAAVAASVSGNKLLAASRARWTVDDDREVDAWSDRVMAHLRAGASLHDALERAGDEDAVLPVASEPKAPAPMEAPVVATARGPRAPLMVELPSTVRRVVEQVRARDAARIEPVVAPVAVSAPPAPVVVAPQPTRGPLIVAVPSALKLVADQVRVEREVPAPAESSVVATGKGDEDERKEAVVQQKRRGKGETVEHVRLTLERTGELCFMDLVREAKVPAGSMSGVLAHLGVSGHVVKRKSGERAFFRLKGQPVKSFRAPEVEALPPASPPVALAGSLDNMVAVMRARREVLAAIIEKARDAAAEMARLDDAIDALTKAAS